MTPAIRRATEIGAAKRRVHTALREALGRLKLAVDQRDSDHLFAAAIEAATWIVALDDYLEEHDPDYASRRASDPGGRIVRGLRLPRNCAVHDLVAIHTADQVAATNNAFGAVWKPLEPPRRQQANLAAYEEHVCGKPVDETLRAAWDFLWTRADGGLASADGPPWLG